MDRLKRNSFEFRMMKISDLQDNLHINIENLIIEYLKETGITIVTLSETIRCKNRDIINDKEVFIVDKIKLDGDYLQMHCIYSGEEDYWIDSCIIYTEDLISIFEFMLDS
jgi:hypothetical protein